MFAPIRSIMIPLWVGCIAGGAIVILLAIGLFSWITFVLAAILGLVAGIPAAIYFSREIREDAEVQDGSKEIKAQ
ncbi:hypothetical protein [Amaricoccus tamworthensis]|uniref:hypothetical protein n=1 Tax=Amaricoccus tamworthensis TaxID=57002 RepID=UPI003C799E64